MYTLNIPSVLTSSNNTITADNLLTLLEQLKTYLYSDWERMFDYIGGTYTIKIDNIEKYYLELTPSSFYIFCIDEAENYFALRFNW